MKQNIVYVGLDVDNTQYHGSALDKSTGEVITFKCRPTLNGLLKQLDRLQKCFLGSVFRLCYEAFYIGYTLQRDLVEKGYHCDVVAPTSIPSPRGKQTLPPNAVELSRPGIRQPDPPPWIVRDNIARSDVISLKCLICKL